MKKPEINTLMAMANGFKLTTHQKADALKEIDQIILYIEEKEQGEFHHG